MSGDSPTIAERVRLLRDRLGVTQVDLADMLGIRSVTVSRWERGETAPTLADMATVILLERGAANLFGHEERDRSWRDLALLEMDRRIYRALFVERRFLEAAALVISTGIEVEL